MQRREVSPRANPVVQQLINTFLVPAPGRSPEKTKQRILDWIEKVNHPSRFLPSGADADAIAEFCRKARQNVRRLTAKYPRVADEIISTVKPEDVR